VRDSFWRFVGVRGGVVRSGNRRS